jgi:3-oxoacyl-[acyl-carrier protein] reductase
MMGKARTAVVAGGGGGIGRATGLRLAAEEMRVAVLGRSEESVSATAEMIEATGGEARRYIADVRDEGGVAAAMADAARWGEGIHLLVNAAGIYREGLFEKISTEIVDELVDINLTGQVWTIRHALPFMGEGGSIVNVGSMSGVRPLPAQAVYAAVKAAVVHLGTALAAELAPRGIRVNTVSPGPTATPILETILPAEAIPAVQRELAEAIPLGRLAEPEEIADAIAWVACADYATGSHLVIDGGTVL